MNTYFLQNATDHTEYGPRVLHRQVRSYLVSLNASTLKMHLRRQMLSHLIFLNIVLWCPGLLVHWFFLFHNTKFLDCNLFWSMFSNKGRDYSTPSIFILSSDLAKLWLMNCYFTIIPILIETNCPNQIPLSRLSIGVFHT